jgi:hypothetical protein
MRGTVLRGVDPNRTNRYATPVPNPAAPSLIGAADAGRHADGGDLR